MAAFVAVLSTGACGFFDGTPPPPCPEVALLANTERLVQFRPGPGRDIIDIVTEAQITNLRSACEYEDFRVDVNAAFEIIATRGPKAGTASVTIPFFVAVVRPDGRVVAKKVFESKVDFPKGRRRVGLRESVEERVPLSSQTLGRDYQILVGFQLTPDQLEYNQLRRR